MRYPLVLAAALLGQILVAPPVAAQETANSRIVVEAQREIRRAEARAQAGDIANHPSERGFPIARFHDPICPGVFGLDEASARLIIDRIMYNAEAIGLPVSSEEGCTANVVLAFVKDPLAEFQDLRDHDSPLVRGIDLSERKRVAALGGPVVAWNLIQTKSRDGIASDRDPPVFETTMSGRTGLAVRRDIAVSVMLIDSDTVDGIDGVSLADYATMRALAKTRTPKDEPSFNTVLTLFDDGADRDARLSAFDLAYLRSVYESADNKPPRMAFSDLATKVQDVKRGE